MPSNDSIRKAAILVSALDTAQADALLEGMGDELAARVRACVMELDEIDPLEQQRIIEQFLGGGASDAIVDDVEISAAPPEDESVAAEPVSLSDYLAQQADEDANSDSDPPDEEAGAESVEPAPFLFLNDMTGDELAHVLRHEHAQAAAVVLAHLAPAAAAAAMAHLPAAMQADVARRIVNLDVVDEGTLRVLEEGLQRQIGTSMVGGSRTGLTAMQNILAAAPRAHKDRLLRSFQHSDARLAVALAGGHSDAATRDGVICEPTEDAHDDAGGPAPAGYEFEDLEQLGDDGLRRVLQQANGRVLLLALAGASGRLMERIYGQLPARQARQLRQQIEQQGPISLRDVVQAQRHLGKIAAQLAAAGEIDEPPVRRFTVAA